MTDQGELAPLQETALDDLGALLLACLEQDGGLPEVVEPSFLRRLFLDGPGVGVWDADGRLVGAVALGKPSDGVVPVSGAVHPANRGRGLGASLLEWSVREAHGARMLLRSESVTVELEVLASALGFTKVFGELILRRTSHPPNPTPLGGFATRTWSSAIAPAFFSAYHSAFADRPGFPGWAEQEWIDRVIEDEAFRPDASLVVLDATDQPIGFVLISGAWIDQVGVVPTWRRKGVATGLIAHAIERIDAAGSDQAWLSVNENNASAIALYGGLGFTQFGRRGRFERDATD